MSFVSVNFKVYGKVQGVFFRKFTQAQAKSLDLKGWVRNEYDGTVTGLIQGAANNVETMKQWLMNKGSPHSRIDRCEFSQEKLISEPEYHSFEILR